ncbi:MAG: PEP-CTERM sorting domain-containing protein [Cellvibrio sp.]|uniref:PEP-CTERM sorting domain-containing protein n=1 Tax=Cellvibrio sp. TaxID=1965322 RepID=UPI0031A140F1
MVFLAKLLPASRSVITALVVTGLMLFSVGKAQAVNIDFDDLNPADLIGDDGYIPLTNQYESLGVLFESGAYLLGYSPKSAPNYVNGPGFSIHFLGVLPTYVSMYVGSNLEHKVGIRAYGVNGYFEDRLTDGEVRGMQWEDSTPYRPNQFISFYMPEGISSINLAGQADTYMDDLTFSVSVPEPSSLLLLFLGMLITYLHRKRLQ